MIENKASIHNFHRSWIRDEMMKETKRSFVIPLHYLTCPGLEYNSLYEDLLGLIRSYNSKIELQKNGLIKEMPNKIVEMHNIQILYSQLCHLNQLNGQIRNRRLQSIYRFFFPTRLKPKKVESYKNYATSLLMIEDEIPSYEIIKKRPELSTKFGSSDRNYTQFSDFITQPQTERDQALQKLKENKKFSQSALEMKRKKFKLDKNLYVWSKRKARFEEGKLFGTQINYPRGKKDSKIKFDAKKDIQEKKFTHFEGIKTMRLNKVQRVGRLKQLLNKKNSDNDNIHMQSEEGFFSRSIVKLDRIGEIGLMSSPQEDGGRKKKRKKSRKKTMQL